VRKNDIIHLVRKHEADFTSEINDTIGPVNNYRFCNGVVRIGCKSATQLDALLAIKEFLHEAVTVTRPWTGSDKAMEKAREAGNKSVRFNKVVITGVSLQWTNEDIKDGADAE